MNLRAFEHGFCVFVLVATVIKCDQMYLNAGPSASKRQQSQGKNTNSAPVSKLCLPEKVFERSAPRNYLDLVSINGYAQSLCFRIMGGAIILVCVCLFLFETSCRTEMWDMLIKHVRFLFGLGWCDAFYRF